MSSRGALATVTLLGGLVPEVLGGQVATPRPPSELSPTRWGVVYDVPATRVTVEQDLPFLRDPPWSSSMPSGTGRTIE
jgi:hypothetical protein